MIDDFRFHQFLQRFQIHDHPRFGVDVSLHRNFQDVVVTMAVGVVAQAKNGRIFFFGEGWIEQAVAGAKFQFSGNVNHQSCGP